MMRKFLQKFVLSRNILFRKIAITIQIFKNIFTKKPTTDPKPMTKSSSTSILDEMSERDLSPESKAPSGTKSKNIFKRKKKQEDNPHGETAEGESDIYSPISIASVDKPMKTSKSWTGRIKIPGKRYVD